MIMEKDKIKLLKKCWELHVQKSMFVNIKLPL